MPLENISKTSQAAESGCQSDIKHRQTSIGEQAFGKQQSACLQVLNRLHIVFCRKNTPQVPGGAAEPSGDFLQLCPLPQFSSSILAAR